MRRKLERITGSACRRTPEVTAPKDVVHIAVRSSRIGSAVQTARRRRPRDEKRGFRMIRVGKHAVHDSGTRQRCLAFDIVEPEADVPAFGAKVFDIASSAVFIRAIIARLSLAGRPLVVMNSLDIPRTTAGRNARIRRYIDKPFASGIRTSDVFRILPARPVVAELIERTSLAGLRILAQPRGTAMRLVGCRDDFTAIHRIAVAIGITSRTRLNHTLAFRTRHIADMAKF